MRRKLGAELLELLQHISNFSPALKAEKCAADQLRSHVAGARYRAHYADQFADFDSLQVAELDVRVHAFECQLKHFIFAHIVDYVVGFYGPNKRPESSYQKVLKNVELPLYLLGQPGVERFEVGPVDLRGKE